jgi:hypothetical protein
MAKPLLSSLFSSTNLAGQYAAVTLKKLTTSIWIFIGNLA